MFKLLTVGADPEVFLYDINEKKVISAVNKIGGSKEFPLVIYDNEEKEFKVLEDNVTIEYNIPPATNIAEFIASNKFMLETIRVIIPDNCNISITSSEIFSEEELEAPEAKVFGCVESLDAWTGDIFQIGIDPEKDSIRSAGGHIHIGYEDPTNEKNVHLVRALDNILGVYSREQDKESVRNNNYGRFGNYRETWYGIEYRTPSNWWLKSEETMRMLFKLIEMSFDYANTHQEINSVEEKNLELIKENLLVLEKV